MTLSELSISNNLSKFYFLNHHLKSHVHKNHSPIIFLYLVYNLDSYFRYLSLASEKSGIDDGYIWITT